MIHNMKVIDEYTVKKIFKELITNKKYIYRTMQEPVFSIELKNQTITTTIMSNDADTLVWKYNYSHNLMTFNTSLIELLPSFLPLINFITRHTYYDLLLRIVLTYEQKTS
jgi:hypothetical protein